SCRSRHTSFSRDWCSDVCSFDLYIFIFLIRACKNNHYLRYYSHIAKELLSTHLATKHGLAIRLFRSGSSQVILFWGCTSNILSLYLPQSSTNLSPCTSTKNWLPSLLCFPS